MTLPSVLSSLGLFVRLEPQAPLSLVSPSRQSVQLYASNKAIKLSNSALWEEDVGVLYPLMLPSHLCTGYLIAFHQLT